MKNRKRVIALAALLVIGLSTGGYALNRTAFGYGFGHGFGHGGSARENVLSHMDYTIQELKLNADQQAEYSAVRERMSRDLDTLVSRHNAFRDALHSEMAKPEPDVNGMAERMKREIALMSDSASTQIDYVMEVYAILDDGQKKQLSARVKDHMTARSCFDDD